jgi:hypothetical protein
LSQGGFPPESLRSNSLGGRLALAVTDVAIGGNAVGASRESCGCRYSTAQRDIPLATLDEARRDVFSLQYRSIASFKLTLDNPERKNRLDAISVACSAIGVSKCPPRAIEQTGLTHSFSATASD